MQSRAEAKDQLVGDSRLYDVLVGPNDLYADLGVGLLVDTLELGHATAIYSGAVQTDTARHSTSRPEQVQMAGGAMVEIVTLVLTLTGVGNTARGTTAVARQAVGGAAAEVTAPAAARIVPTLGYGRGSIIDAVEDAARRARAIASKEATGTIDEAYRVHGGGADAAGGFASTVPAESRIQAKLDLALLPEWGNSRQFEAVIKVPEGTTLNIGTVAPQTIRSTGTVLPGGAPQVLLPQNWPAAWIRSIRRVDP